MLYNCSRAVVPPDREPFELYSFSRNEVLSGCVGGSPRSLWLNMLYQSNATWLLS